MIFMRLLKGKIDSDHLKETVRSLKASGIRAQDISIEFNIPRSRVYRYCKQGWREQKQKRNNEIRKWFGRGYPQAELGREFGMSRQRVHAICKRNREKETHAAIQH